MRAIISIPICLLCVAGALLAGPADVVHKPFSEGLGNGDKRIINGAPAERGQFPHQGALFYSNSFTCGCSLISELYAVTAAHCTYLREESKFSILFGATRLDQPEGDSQRVQVLHKYENPYYNPYYLIGDVSVVQLNSPVTFTSYIKAIKLTGSPDDVVGGSQLITSGWGRTNDSSPFVSNRLLYATVTAIDRDDCAEVYGSTTINEGVICVRAISASNTTGICNGDSGGPLIFPKGGGGTAALVGITSFTHVAGCESNNPGGFSRVQAALRFIQEISGV